VQSCNHFISIIYSNIM